MSKVPTVFCPKENKKVPVWYCVGSFMRGRKQCPYCAEATIYYGKKAKVKCDWKETKTMTAKKTKKKKIDVVEEIRRFERRESLEEGKKEVEKDGE